MIALITSSSVSSGDGDLGGNGDVDGVVDALALHAADLSLLAVPFVQVVLADAGASTVLA
jgi:hypothetical protein